MDINLKIPLKELLTCACIGNYTQRHLQELYRLVYTIARRAIRRKILYRKLPIDALGLSEADITHDCIVELFSLGPERELSEISKYFTYQHLILDEQPEEILFVHLRRLVFSIVNDNIFRLYHEADPSLGRIIRNMKIAVGNRSPFKITSRFDEYFLELTTCDRLASCTTIDDEDLHREVFEILSTENEIPDILRRLAEFLTYQEVYQRRVRMVSLALAIKKGYERVGHPDKPQSIAIETSFVEDDTERTIIETCRTISTEMYPRYVDKKKVDEKTFNCYMKAVERALRGEFIDGTDGEITYFEHLRLFKTGLTKDEYMKNDRVIVEYLAKISKKRVRERLKKIL